MKIIKASEIDYVPASHEDAANPGVWKKVLLRKNDLQDGRVQMVNWAMLPAGASFAPHYHEDMEEVFLIIKGSVEMTGGKTTERCVPGDTLVIPARETHVMRNVGEEAAEYIVFGVAQETGGKTVVV